MTTGNSDSMTEEFNLWRPVYRPRINSERVPGPWFLTLDLAREWIVSATPHPKTARYEAAVVTVEGTEAEVCSIIDLLGVATNP